MWTCLDVLKDLRAVPSCSTRLLHWFPRFSPSPERACEGSSPRLTLPLACSLQHPSHLPVTLISTPHTCLSIYTTRTRTRTLCLAHTSSFEYLGLFSLPHQYLLCPNWTRSVLLLDYAYPSACSNVGNCILVTQLERCSFCPTGISWPHCYVLGRIS